MNLRVEMIRAATLNRCPGERVKRPRPSASGLPPIPLVSQEGRLNVGTGRER